MRSLGLLALVPVAVTVALAAPSSAAPAPSHAPAARASHAPVAPATGKWHITGDITGAFRVTSKHRYAKSLHATIGADAETACGTGKVSVVGKHRIFDAKGDNSYGHYSQWIVGRNVSSAIPTIQPEKVTVIHDGKRVKGKYDLAFVGRHGHNKNGNAFGEISYDHGNCDLQFDVKK
jgi:hypothetical protein